MNSQILVDAIVQQTTALIAQVATAQGVRSPLAHLANQVFFDLSRELEAQGVSRKVSADMFGMALRAYIRKTKRLRESSTVRGQSLWEAVYSYLRSKDVVSRGEVLTRFAEDDDAIVVGVLRDLTETGLVFATGTGEDARYRVVRDHESTTEADSPGQADEILWAIVYNGGPLSATELRRLGGLQPDAFQAALERLLSSGRIEHTEVDGQEALAARRFFVPLGSTEGWEGAVVDHFAAVIKTISRKLRLQASSSPDDRTGGSTYSFIVWKGHPLQGEVATFLGRFRREMSELRSRVQEHNDGATRPSGYEKVVIYGGQCVTEESQS